MSKKLVAAIILMMAGMAVAAVVTIVYNPPRTFNTTHPIIMNGAADYDVLIENLGDQVRVTEELNALQAQKIRKLQQQIEILDTAGLRACDYLRRISTELTFVHQGLKAASLKELDLEKVQNALSTLRTNVMEAGKDINTIFLSSPVYHVPVEKVRIGKAAE